MFSYFWKFYTSYLRGVAQPQMAKSKLWAGTLGGSTPANPQKPAKRRIAYMDESDDENNDPRKDAAMKSLSAKLDAHSISSPRPTKKAKIANTNGSGAAGSSKQAAIQEQRKQLPIAIGMYQYP